MGGVRRVSSGASATRMSGRGNEGAMDLLGGGMGERGVATEGLGCS